MSKKIEEYLARQRELGYEPDLRGMDEDDFDYVPSWSSQNPNRPPARPLGQTYRPVDREFAERIFKMFAKPYDPRWKMPDLDGPEFRQPAERSPRLTGDEGSERSPVGSGNSGGPVETLEYRYDRDGKAEPRLKAYAAEGGQDGGKGVDLKVWVDPLGMFPQYEYEQGSAGSSGSGTYDRYRNGEIVPGANGRVQEDDNTGNKVTQGGVKLWSPQNPDWDNLHPTMKDTTTTFISDINKQFGTNKIPWVTSGYRSPERNATIPGASPTSWHTKGLAVDIDLSEFTAEEKAKIEQMARERFQEVLYHDAGDGGIHLHIGNPVENNASEVGR